MTVSIVYVGPYDEVETEYGIARRGERFEVPGEAAGSPPRGRPWGVDDAGESTYDPGAGFLAQPDNWQRWKAAPAKRTRAPKAAPRKAAAKPGPSAASEAQSAEQHTTEES